jgi:SAM-dependent methyltransferase
MKPYSLQVPEIYHDLARRYPDLFPLRPLEDFAWAREVSGILMRDKLKLVDLGGGLNVFNGVLSKLGASITVFDIFEHDLGWIGGTDPTHFEELCRRRKEILAEAGVAFVNHDVCSLSLSDYFEMNSIDAVTSYHCLEHLHQSPKTVLESALMVLKPGGSLLIEVPNALNLLKRVKVLLGETNYGRYSDYYCSENFTGHVREYSVADLGELANNLGMRQYRIYGRNWYGTLFTRLGYGFLGRSVDYTLRAIPSLCGSLFLHYIKP